MTELNLLCVWIVWMYLATTPWSKVSYVTTHSGRTFEHCAGMVLPHTSSNSVLSVSFCVTSSLPAFLQLHHFLSLSSQVMTELLSWRPVFLTVVQKVEGSGEEEVGGVNQLGQYLSCNVQSLGPILEACVLSSWVLNLCGMRARVRKLSYDLDFQWEGVQVFGVNWWFISWLRGHVCWNMVRGVIGVWLVLKSFAISKVCDLGFVSSHDQEHIVTREVTMYDVICKSA